VERTLAGLGRQLKEYSIGVDVFGRGESFDPRADTIVRAQARKLRSKLAKYYETEGKHNPLRIEFLKGSYAARICLAETPVPPHVTDAIPADSTHRLNGTHHLNGTHDPIDTQGLNGKPRAEGEHRSSKGNFSASRLSLGALSLFLVVAAAAAYVTHQKRPESPRADQGHSVVVLPFLSLSGDQADKYFSDGLTDEIITSLVRVPGLQVSGRTSAFQFKGKPVDMGEIGRHLQVRFVIEGSVRRAGDQVRVTAGLIEARNGYQLWSQSYDRELKDVLGIQRDISQHIIYMVDAKLTGGTREIPAAEQPAKAVTLNPQAHDDYLKGLYTLHQPTSANLQSAIGYFEHAITEDANYAPAYASLAHASVRLALDSSEADASSLEKATALARKAIELDASLGEPHLDLAEVAERGNDWRTAERELKRALELEPGNSLAHLYYGNYLVSAGRVDESIVEFEKAVQLDPLAPLVLDSLPRALYYARRYDEAIEHYRHALAVAPDYGPIRQGLAFCYVQKKQYAQALTEMQHALPLTGDRVLGMGQLGYVYARSANREATSNVLRQLLNQSDKAPARPVAVAHVYLGMQDADQAIQWLTKAIDLHPGVLQLKADPVYDPLRADPRFTALLSRINLTSN
jgi:TolB-like protein/tetratricopeptide (TPR) repeat protein